MKILIAADLYWPTTNGVASFGRNLANGLSDRGHEVVVIAPSQNGKKGFEYDGTVRVERVSSLPFPFYQNFRVSINPTSEVKKITKEFKPDIIHMQNMLGIGHAIMSVGNKLRIPIVATNHGMPENLLDNLRLLAPFARPIGEILENYGARFFNNADYLTTPTQAAIEMFSDKKHKIKIPFEAVSNGIDLSKFSPGPVPDALYRKFRLPTDVPIVTYVGRLDSEKHLPVLVRAMAKALKEEKAHLLIVGHGNEGENLKNIAKKLRINKRMTLTGRVSEEDMPLLHRIGSIFAISSPAELQSIATLEAMASGKPVVAVNAGALYELCHDGKNGYLYDLDDDTMMAEKLVSLLKNEKQRNKMGKESSEIAKTHDLSYTLDSFEAIYKKVIR